MIERCSAHYVRFRTNVTDLGATELKMLHMTLSNEDSSCHYTRPRLLCGATRPMTRRISCMSLGMTVTRFAWMAASFLL
jgi:hypothetical protein